MAAKPQDVRLARAFAEIINEDFATSGERDGSAVLVAAMTVVGTVMEMLPPSRRKFHAARLASELLRIGDGG